MSADKVTILYNGIDAFYPQPTPFISANFNNIYYSEIWAKEEVFTLNGQLTGCTFAGIEAARQNLVANFSKQYQGLEIWQTQAGVSGKIYQKDLVQIESISFNTDRWVGILPYTMTVKCYPSGFFSGSFGVLEPSDTWNFVENENYTAQIKHTISCKGFNTSSNLSNALDNAKNWAISRRPITSDASPIFIGGFTTGNLCLTSSEEEINRLNGSYSVTDTYNSDLTRTGYGILRYSATFDSGIKGISVSLNGSVQGCGQNLPAIRSTFQSFDKLGAAQLCYTKNYGFHDLNPIPLNYKVDEDPYNTILNFSYLYNNDDYSETYYDYTVQLTSGNSIGVSINGNIITRGGDIHNKITKSKLYAASLNLYDIVLPYYNDFYPYSTQQILNPRPVSSGLSIKESDGSVQLSAEFNNFAVISDVLDAFDYKMSFVPSLQRLDSQQRLNGQGIFSIVDLGYANRASLTINGSAVTNLNYSPLAGVETVKQKAMQLLSVYGRFDNIVLDKNTVNYDRTDERLISFNFTWSFDSPNRVIDNGNYVSVDTLSL